MSFINRIDDTLTSWMQSVCDYGYNRGINALSVLRFFNDGQFLLTELFFVMAQLHFLLFCIETLIEFMVTRGIQSDFKDIERNLEKNTLPYLRFGHSNPASLLVRMTFLSVTTGTVLAAMFYGNPVIGLSAIACVLTTICLYGITVHHTTPVKKEMQGNLVGVCS